MSWWFKICAMNCFISIHRYVQLEEAQVLVLAANNSDNDSKNEQKAEIEAPTSGNISDGSDTARTNTGTIEFASHTRSDEFDTVYQLKTPQRNEKILEMSAKLSVDIGKAKV